MVQKITYLATSAFFPVKLVITTQADQLKESVRQMVHGLERQFFAKVNENIKTTLSYSTCFRSLLCKTTFLHLTSLIGFVFAISPRSCPLWSIARSNIWECVTRVMPKFTRIRHHVPFFLSKRFQATRKTSNVVSQWRTVVGEYHGIL